MSVGRFKLCFVLVVTGASKARTTPSKALCPGRRGISQLESLAGTSRDLFVNAYGSARGYLLFQEGDLCGAADELAADPHTPLALQQLALAQEKLGNATAAQLTGTRLKYQRAPNVEWFLVTHQNAGLSH